MFKNLSFSRLTSAEFYQFMNLINGIADAADPVASKFKSKKEVFAAVLQRLLAALNQEQANILTKQIEELDSKRDVLVTGFVTWVNGLVGHPNAAIRQNAFALQNYLKSFGSRIANQNYQAETATIIKIVDDLKNDVNLKNSLLALKDTEWLPALESSNNDFVTLYQTRSSEMGASINNQSFADVKKESIAAYYNLIDIIGTRLKTAIEDGASTIKLQKCADDINATIDQYRQLIINTQSRSSKTTTTETTK